MRSWEGLGSAIQSGLPGVIDQWGGVAFRQLQRSVVNAADQAFLSDPADTIGNPIWRL